MKGRAMRRRWSSWWRAVTMCGLIASYGVVLAGNARRLVPLSGLVLAVSFVIVMAVVLYGAMNDAWNADRGDGEGWSRRQKDEWVWRLKVATGAVALMLSIVVTGLMSPWWVVALLAVLMATMPPVRDTLRRYMSIPAHRSQPARPVSVSSWGTSARSHQVAWRTVQDELADPRAWVAGLDPTELCHLWRITYWTVRQPQSPAQTVQVIQLRQAVLEELEKQRPDAVEAWLMSGRHRADPASYL